MAEQEGKVTVYRQMRNPKAAEQAGRLNRTKLIVIAVFGVIGVIFWATGVYEEGRRYELLLAPELIWTLFLRGKIGEYLAEIAAMPAVAMVARPYIGFLFLLASYGLTLLWKKSRVFIAVHGVLYFLLGFEIYMAWFPLISILLGEWLCLFLAILLWVFTIVQFIRAWRGYGIIEVKEAEDMDSIFPEKRSGFIASSVDEVH